jgi:hypothetical protein
MGIYTDYLIAKHQNASYPGVNQSGFDTSLAGMITRVVNTAFQRFRGYVQSLFSNPIVVQEGSARTLQASIKNFESSGTQVKGESTSTYLNSLIQASKDIVLIENFLADGQSNSTSEEIKSILQTTIRTGLNENTKFIAIPLIVKGSKGNHITMVLVELENGIIRYFDSFGKPFDHEHNQMNQTSVREIIKQVPTILGSSKFVTRHEETQIQFDTHSCGIFVGEYFKLRVIEKKSHEEAMKILKARDIESTRDAIGKMLRLQLPSIQKINVSAEQSLANEIVDDW